MKKGGGDAIPKQVGNWNHGQMGKSKFKVVKWGGKGGRKKMGKSRGRSRRKKRTHRLRKLRKQATFHEGLKWENDWGTRKGKMGTEKEGGP